MAVPTSFARDLADKDEPVARITLYIVQPFGFRGRDIMAASPSHFIDESAALSRAQHEAATGSGVIVTTIAGEPGSDDWEEPRVIFTSGQVPHGIAGGD